MANCIYCGCEATNREHFIPWTFNHSGKRKKTFRNQKGNINPSCAECNSMAGNKVFNTLEEKRSYISERIERKYKKILRLPDWSEEQLNELSIRLKKDTKIKLLAKKWIVNRIHYPTIIYEEQPIKAELDEIMKLF